MCGTVGFLCVMAWLLTAGVSAQITSELTFTTKFAFTAGNAKFPAGEYEIRPVDDQPNMIEIVAVKGDHAAFVEIAPAAAPTNSPGSTKITFKQYKGGYVLKNIWDQADRHNVTTALTYAEQKHAKADPAPKDQEVTASKIAKR